jgi:hypothetical protein
MSAIILRFPGFLLADDSKGFGRTANTTRTLMPA